MTAMLSGAALIVLFSDYEAHPVAIMEALCLKRPVLVTDCSGLGEIARKMSLAAIPLGATAAQTAAAMINEIRFPRAAADVALDNWDDCAGRLLKIYLSVARRPGGAHHNAGAAPVRVSGRLKATLD